MRPSRSHFEFIEPKLFITIHRFHVEYPSSAVVMNAGEALTLSPILDHTLLQGAIVSYQLLGVPPFNVVVDPHTGYLKASPVIEGIMSNLTVQFVAEFRSYSITTDLHFQFIILPGKLLLDHVI